jgi:hypothetical protein
MEEGKVEVAINAEGCCNIVLHGDVFRVSVRVFFINRLNVFRQ